MSRFRPTVRRAAAATGALLLAGPLAACSSGATPGSSSTTSGLAQATGKKFLGDVCGKNVVVQLQWQPQADMGALFSLLGPGYKVDTRTHSVTGPLVVDGKDTGTRLTLRAGGPAIGFQSVTSQMYADDSINLGLVHADQMISASGNQKVVGVTPLLTHSPTILMWDPAAYGTSFTISKLAASGATVVVAKDQAFVAWLVAKGLVRKSQIDTSYAGSPARFVADPKIIQQGYSDAEPYEYEHTISAWKKPVSYQLLRDAGYDPYAADLSVRADRLTSYAPCLKKLVPIVQQATANYITDPAATNRLIVKVVGSDSSYIPYTIGEANYAAAELKKDRLVEAEHGTVGGYDKNRTDAFVKEMGPILAAQGSAVPSGLKGSDLFTTQFIDPSIGMP
ncbi:nitrate ABC transporter substrate-binding protein [Actinomadura rayongensis]|uniref:Nitrate ABC transporter substrate-binding protein n=1 Tax=Actinomadura rayongensis TaxID=1429076 RepID=A0A6I4WCP8_9ACTN|nr:nitrate ABC transporter substrate-binding protein [Actinomadura rayongensis]MXQ64522.1 nitrate ABC transporter substrate-binding protein [Actinomadura rayongensis]